MKLFIFAVTMAFWGIVIAALLMGLQGTLVVKPPQVVDKTVLHYFGNEAEGDLNGDGVPDAAFLVTEDGGGSGTFFYVAAALKTSGGYQVTNSVFLGDRIAPQTTAISGGVITVNYADRRAAEPMTTSPSVGVSSHFVVTGGKLTQLPPN